MNNKLTSFLLSFIVFAMTACSANQNDSSSPANEAKKDRYTALAEESNKDEKLEKLELLPYAEEVEASLSRPKYKEFKANSTVLLFLHIFQVL